MSKFTGWIFDTLSFIVRAVIRYVVAWWICQFIFPDWMSGLAYALYVLYSIGKTICGGYSKKKSATDTNE